MFKTLRFKLLCSKINKLASSIKNKEYIDEFSAFEAYSYIKLMKLVDKGDYLLFLSAVNLLNSYVKQDDSKISYRFKNELNYLLDQIIESKPKFLKINKDEGELMVYQIYNVQFSFHYVKSGALDQTLYDKELKWDNIRKQPGALSIYNLCKNNSLFKSNSSINGNTLELEVNNLLIDYQIKKIDFDYFDPKM